MTVGFPDYVEQWGRYRGRTVDVVHAYSERNSWQGIETAGWILGYYKDSGAAIVISQPFWPEGSGGSLSACASGAYDSHWKSYGRSLVQAGRVDTYTRLAWEFNGDWFEWRASDVATWKRCYARVVQAVRSTAPEARFEWNMNAHGSQSAGGDAWSAYPGDDVVDVVGVDSYDYYPASRTAAAFDTQCRGAEGLCTVLAFARKHGKKAAISEWGVIAEDGGGGDNAVYIAKMFETFAANSDVIAYETYFNSTDHHSALMPAQNSSAAARYRALWGGQ